MVSRTPVMGAASADIPALMVLDEFAGLKRMEVIEHAVAQIAGYGVKMFFVLQSLEQPLVQLQDSLQIPEDALDLARG